MIRVLVAALAALSITSQAQALTFDNNVPAGTKDQMLADLEFMNTITGAQVSPLHQSVYGPMQGSGYSTWFHNRVKKVGYDPSDRGGAVAYVAPFLDSTKMVVTSNFVKFSHPQIARMMVVYHEARHTENEHGNWHHATCPVPFRDAQGNDIKSIWTGMQLAGEDACDSSAIGAYGSTVIMMKNISINCETCNEKVKMDAGIYADDQYKRVTNATAKENIKKDVYGSTLH